MSWSRINSSFRLNIFHISPCAVAWLTTLLRLASLILKWSIWSTISSCSWKRSWMTLNFLCLDWVISYWCTSCFLNIIKFSHHLLYSFSSSNILVIHLPHWSLISFHYWISSHIWWLKKVWHVSILLIIILNACIGLVWFRNLILFSCSLAMFKTWLLYSFLRWTSCIHYWGLTLSYLLCFHLLNVNKW